MPDTYRDGIGAIRCQMCGQALRDGAEGVLVSGRLHDVYRLVAVLSELTTLGVESPMTDALIDRLSKAAGQSVAMIIKRVNERTEPR